MKEICDELIAVLEEMSPMPETEEDYQAFVAAAVEDLLGEMNENPIADYLTIQTLAIACIGWLKSRQDRVGDTFIW